MVESVESAQTRARLCCYEHTERERDTANDTFVSGVNILPAVDNPCPNFFVTSIASISFSTQKTDCQRKNWCGMKRANASLNQLLVETRAWFNKVTSVVKT